MFTLTMKYFVLTICGNSDKSWRLNLINTTFGFYDIFFETIHEDWHTESYLTYTKEWKK